MNNTYEYLIQNYEENNVQKLENGGYLVSNVSTENSKNNMIYVPENMGSNVSMISYYPGTGGSTKDGAAWINKVKSEFPPNAIVTIASKSTQNHEIMETGLSIATGTGSNVTNVVMNTFSDSGRFSLTNMDAFNGNHPEITATVVINDGCITDPAKGDYPNLINNQVPIIAVATRNGFNYGNVKGALRGFEKYGLNFYLLESHHTDGDNHQDANNDVINNNLVEYILGITDEMNGRTLEQCNYTLYKCVDGSFVLVGETGQDLSVVRQINNTADLTVNLSKMPSNTFEEGTVGYDMYNVVSGLNGIRGTIAPIILEKPNNTSTATIPANLVDAQESLMCISGDLLNTLNKETEIIASIAQTFYDMDQERSNAAGELSDGSGLLNSRFNSEDILNNILNTDISSELTFKSFMFNPSSHVEGNSGKICLSDINAMLNGSSLNGPLHNNLENERNGARNTKSKIDELNSMITSGGNFQGEIWNKVSDKLNQYSGLMDMRIEMADKVEAAMVEALTLIKNYMGDYEELDDSKLPELREKITQTKAQIAEAQTIINATKQVTHTYTDSSGKVQSYTTTEYVYSASTRQAAMKFITEATILLKELTEEVTMLEGLPIILAQAEQIVNDAMSEVYSKYGVSVSDVVVGKQSNYIPPVNTSYTGTLPVANKDLGIEREIPEGKVSEAEFDQSLGLQHIYGTYNDYLNGVESKNNPMHNPAKEDTGIVIDNIFGNPVLDDDNEQEEIPDENQDDEFTAEPDTDNPKGENPNNDKPSGDKPSNGNPDNDKPSGDKPSNGNPNNDKPNGDKPVEDKPVEDKPVEDKPVDDKPVEDKPVEDKPVEDKPVEDKPKPSNPSRPSGENSYKPTPSIPDIETNEDLIVDNETENIPDDEVIPDNEIDNNIPPIVEIPDDEIIDITPDNVYDNKDDSSASNEGSDLVKKIGIGIGVGAAVGSAALGAHTYSKVKKNNIYEED
ncbi:MAG: hypothetical protein IJ475_03160 [Bacilli bacterium]|nr:hypothetical protein [Bacilli bacterium]